MAETFAEEVFRRRNELHLTQQQLAERAGINRVTVGSVERGDRAVSPSTVVKLRLALGALDSEPVPVADGEAGACAELAAIGEMVGILERLGIGERRRALAYLHDRFGGAG